MLRVALAKGRLLKSFIEYLQYYPRLHDSGFKFLTFLIGTRMQILVSLILLTMILNRQFREQC